MNDIDCNLFAALEVVEEWDLPAESFAAAMFEQAILMTGGTPEFFYEGQAYL